MTSGQSASLLATRRLHASWRIAQESCFSYTDMREQNKTSWPLCSCELRNQEAPAVLGQAAERRLDSLALLRGRSDELAVRQRGWPWPPLPAPPCGGPEAPSPGRCGSGAAPSARPCALPACCTSCGRCSGPAAGSARTAQPACSVRSPLWRGSAPWPLPRSSRAAPSGSRRTRRSAGASPSSRRSPQPESRQALQVLQWSFWVSPSFCLIRPIRSGRVSGTSGHNLIVEPLAADVNSLASYRHKYAPHFTIHTEYATHLHVSRSLRPPTHGLRQHAARVKPYSATNTAPCDEQYCAFSSNLLTFGAKCVSITVDNLAIASRTIQATRVARSTMLDTERSAVADRKGQRAYALLA